MPTDSRPSPCYCTAGPEFEMTDLHSLLADVRLAGMIHLALKAGDAIMEIYAGAFSHELKDDRTPVTEADTAAEAIILAGLATADPSTPVISEEAASEGRIPEVGGSFYLVDPLDGTREFIGRNGEFTVNIALIADGRPVAGVVYAPARSRLYCGRRGHGAAMTAIGTASAEKAATWRSIAVSGKIDGAVRVVASRSHRDAETEAFLARLGKAVIVAAGSSLKFCLVAAGEADLYPRFGRTMEWDTAAGQAVLEAAGGTVMTRDGAPLGYGKRADSLANPAFIAGSASAAEIVKALLTKPR